MAKHSAMDKRYTKFSTTFPLRPAWAVILTVGDCEWTVQTLNRHRLNRGEQVGLKFDPAHLHLFSASSQERIIW